jgi:hypothetical protein
MAKRFTDSDKWKKPFIRSLEGPYKLLWFYIIDDCDHAGIWQVDFEVACIRTGQQLDEKKALELFGDRIEIFHGGAKWFLKDFISFQYGELNEKNRLHLSVINILKKNEVGPYKPLTRAQGQGKRQGNGQGKEQGQGKSDEPEILIWPTFDDFWDKYDKKTGKPECIKLWGKISQTDREIIMHHLEEYTKKEKAFRKDPERYLKKETWNDEIILSNGTGTNGTATKGITAQGTLDRLNSYTD